MNAHLPLLMHAMAALGIGLALGIQREYDRSRRPESKQGRMAAISAGVRTFTIVALCGNLATWLPRDIMPWAVGIGLAFVAALAIAAYRATSGRSETDKGSTTEVALVATYILGTLTGLGYAQPAIIVSIVILALLQFKRILHRFSYALSAADIEQAVQFLIITVIILPLTGYGLIFTWFGGMGHVGTYIHVMAGLGLVMIALFVYLFFVPYPRLRRAVAAGEWPEGAAHLASIRRIVTTNLILGLITSAVAVAGRFV